jgi:hypothetical protein
MNMVGFLEVDSSSGENVRRLHFTENDRFYAKDHFDAFLPDGYLEDPTLAEIMTRVHGLRAVMPTTRRGRR